MRVPTAVLLLVGLGLVACSRRTNAPTPTPEPAAPSAETAPPAVPTPTFSGPLRPIPNAPGNSVPPNAVAEKAAGPPRDGCAGLFDPPEGAVKLCNEHTMGGDAEIHWTSWAVTTSRMDAFERYRTRATACSASVTTKPPILSVTKDETRLSVHDATETGYPSCANRPPPSHASVIIISTRHVRR
ncbi:MAG: hypothetical protein K0S65_4882 [Labilithrix sp.]|nr:hypothetical protein [Labilithrix sp.]